MKLKRRICITIRSWKCYFLSFLAIHLHPSLTVYSTANAASSTTKTRNAASSTTTNASRQSNSACNASGVGWPFYCSYVIFVIIDTPSSNSSSSVAISFSLSVDTDKKNRNGSSGNVNLVKKFSLLTNLHLNSKVLLVQFWSFSNENAETVFPKFK